MSIPICDVFPGCLVAWTGPARPYTVLAAFMDFFMDAQINACIFWT